MNDGKQATPPSELERQICSATEPKNEREWWAHHEIGRLRAALAEADEPVAWRYKVEGSEKWRLSAMTPDEAREWNDIVEEEPLYTHPQRAHGIGTDE